MMAAFNGTILATLLGGLLTIAGSLAAMWFNARASRRTRMNELIAEHKVKADAEAYLYLKEIEASLAQKSDAETLALMAGHDEWFAANRLFLPETFPETWVSLRTTVQWLVGDPVVRVNNPAHAHELKMRALRLIRDAMRKIREDMAIRNHETVSVE